MAGLRKRGKATAKDYVWEKVIDQLLSRIEFATQRQAVKLPDETMPGKRPTTRALRSLGTK